MSTMSEAMPSWAKSLESIMCARFDKIDREMTAINSRLGNLEQEVAFNRKEMRGMHQSLKDKINQSSKSLEKTVHQDTNEIRERVGVVFEVVVRPMLREKYGRDFARKFVARDLLGIARVSFPKGRHEFGPESTNIDIDIQEKRTQVLCRVLVKHRDVLQNTISEFDSMPKKSQAIDDDLASLKAVLAGNNPQEIERQCARSRVALCAFIRLATGSTIKQTELDFDCRGTVHISKTADMPLYTTEIGEIKSSNNELAITKAKKQLKIRLLTLCFAQSAMACELFWVPPGRELIPRFPMSHHILKAHILTHDRPANQTPPEEQIGFFDFENGGRATYSIQITHDCID